MMLYTLFGAREEFIYARHGGRTAQSFGRDLPCRKWQASAPVEESRYSALSFWTFPGTRTLSYARATAIRSRSSPWISPFMLRIAWTLWQEDPEWRFDTFHTAKGTTGSRKEMAPCAEFHQAAWRWYGPMWAHCCPRMLIPSTARQCTRAKTSLAAGRVYRGVSRSIVGRL